MMACQIDSKTKQLGRRSKPFLHAAKPIFGPWHGFSPGFSFLRFSGLELPTLAANAFELLLMRLGQGLVSRCRARHFCRVDHTSHPVVTLVSIGKQQAVITDYSFIFRWL
ncbi:hypothetical protein FT669_16250 [Aeromonas jandaei]|nr:hypothetical protein FT669_16250 [Aeromonas jandaei]